MIAVTIMITINDRELKTNVPWAVVLVRFVCVSMMHYQYSNDILTALKCMKFIALNPEKFKYGTRAYVSLQLAIFQILCVEALTIYYVMVFGTVLEVVNNFVKMKIISLFDDFFIEPYKTTHMAKFIGLQINIVKFRGEKIMVDQE